MHALPSLVALAAGVALAPALLRALSDGGHTRPNYRGRELPFPFGVLVLAAASLALIPLTLLAFLASAHIFLEPLLPIAIYALGVLALGLVDDTLACDVRGAGEQRVRGWRGHGAALVRGELSTGALKAFGSLGLALLTAHVAGLGLGLRLSDGRWLLAAAVLVLATNVFNLLDLRPGRATKAFVLLGAGLTIGSAKVAPLWALGLFAAPALVAGAYDLRERAMLGDTGANLLGALAGLWLVLTLSTAGQIVALALLAIITVYGEFRSISAFIERTPGLRQLDSLGRPA
jgi:UDP-N-acetylmuramyl pentapeptide phosphotransferase/UDP-N-acetylglucosamine-1-phosphate transferase